MENTRDFLKFFSAEITCGVLSKGWLVSAMEELKTPLVLRLCSHVSQGYKQVLWSPPFHSVLCVYGASPAQSRNKTEDPYKWRCWFPGYDWEDTNILTPGGSGEQKCSDSHRRHPTRCLLGSSSMWLTIHKSSRHKKGMSL